MSEEGTQHDCAADHEPKDSFGTNWKDNYSRPPNQSIPKESIDESIPHEDTAPLDFSMKKRKSICGGEKRISPSPQRDLDDEQGSNYELTKAYLERRASSPKIGPDSPLLVSMPNRRRSTSVLHPPTGPLALTAAAAVNMGAATTINRRNYLTQHLLHRRDLDNNSNEGNDQIDNNCHSTPTTPPAFGHAGHSPHNGHQTNNRYSQHKIQRPFKAYNPMDPMSALQVGASLAPSALPFLNAALSTPSMNGSLQSPGLLSNPLTSSNNTNSSSILPPFLNAQLLSQYRQYIINAQAAAALTALRAKSSEHIQHQIIRPFQHPSQRVQSQLVPNSSSQSPPEVTSTSHPHTAEPNGGHISPANPNISVSVSACNNGSKASAQLTKQGQGTDRRISSESGSGGSSFNGGDEEDEELLHDDDDAVSNRTSPTPSCASSTARRASVATIGSIGMCIGNGNGNGEGSKGENGSSGVNGRRKGRSLPDALKDEAYWERRRKNNEAAKRSRDARRAKEDEIAIRAALLEQENMRLRIELAALKAETEKLRQMLLNT